MGTIAELQGKPDRLYPLLWLSNEGGSLEDNYKVDNIRLTMFGRVIAGEEGQDDDASEIEVLSDMQLILLDFLNYFHQQHGQEYVTDKAATLEHFTERTNDRTAGYSVVLELKQFYDWNKCQIPESGASIPPTVDGLTLYDFCDAATIARLTAEQVVCLEGELCGTPDPVTEQINGVTIGTVASGGINNQVIENTAGTPIGTAANPSVAPDATVDNDATTPTYSESVVSGGTLVLPQGKALDSDGVSTLLANFIPDTDGFMFTCTPCAGLSVSIGVSDSTPNFGDTITLTASGGTYTFVRWFVGNVTDGFEELQLNPNNWNVNRTGTLNVYVVVSDGTNNAWATTTITASMALLVETDASGYCLYTAEDINDAGAVTLNGTKCSALIDQLGNIQNCAQTNAATQPETIEDISHGKDALVMSRTLSNFLSFTGGDSTNYEEITLIYVCQPTATYNTTTGRIFSTWKQGQADYNGANSAAWLETLQIQKSGYSVKHNFGASVHVFGIRYSQSSGYFKLNLSVDGSTITTEDLTSSGSDLGTVIENMRIGYQVDNYYFTHQMFTRILTDTELEAETNKMCYKFAGTII